MRRNIINRKLFFFRICSFRKLLLCIRNLRWKLCNIKIKFGSWNRVWVGFISVLYIDFSV